MITAAQNERLTRVGPGTPGGELLRRYWQPLCPSAELSAAQPKKRVRIMGEDLLVLRGAILALAGDPFPATVRKLAGTDLWRIRLRIHGVPWRIVYQVRDRERLVIITRVARRDEATYRGI